ncbi:anti-sigma regulatory factor (Ser/Thr protein kinase) [Streptomyces umbrinus]|uniref:Anti-sigma regulatory factor (Ser/Thr protein kinase) n=1 Tax=Streptomyces umbrinus TaxID=67370 RepID=A0ABU0SXB7_9ACTN|nr:ATP-binding protein [Streptomyces umbrinus]MDQ1028073.1 anti-sigma regulatory factor (Ser/Thr protein kinase) [Streptomyces umbrinus]
MPMPAPWEYTLYIPHDPRAVGICRRALRDILTSHHLPALVEPAELLASELLRNAIRHTEGPGGPETQTGGTSFRLGTWDTDPAPPTEKPEDDETGRGLRIVHAYADDWGWFQVNGTAGKYVWCELGTKTQ